MNKQEFTVVGYYYEDKVEVFVEWVESEDWASARVDAIHQIAERLGWDVSEIGVTIVEVFAGHQRGLRESHRLAASEDILREGE